MEVMTVEWVVRMVEQAQTEGPMQVGVRDNWRVMILKTQ